MDHPDLGPLLRPLGLKLSVRPLEPVCVAAMEGNPKHLRHCIQQGRDVNELYVDERSALMIAVECGHLECCVALVSAGADIQGALRLSGAETTESRPAIALLTAMASKPFDSQAYQEAMSLLSLEASAEAEVLVERGRRARVAMRKVNLESESPAMPTSTMQEPEPQDYEVVYPSVRIRRAPSVNAEPLSECKRLKGEIVRIKDFNMDEGFWGRIDVITHEGPSSGWMLIRHPQLGDLLRPVVSVDTEAG